MSLFGMGRWVLGLGVALIVAGLLMMFGGRIGLGRLPGDLIFRNGRSTFYFPLVTSIVLSVILTLLLNLFARWRR